MKYSDAIKTLNELLASDLVARDFGFVEAFEPFGGCSPRISRVNPNLPKKDFGHMSGLYFLCSLDEDIYYIGKATKNNLHEEVWGKIKTPNKDNPERKTYPKNYFAGKNLDKEAVADVGNGDIKIGLLVISNPVLVSLAEVYIQSVFYQRNSRELPKLNLRIG